MAELSQVIQMSENSLVDQNPSVLNTTEEYFNDLELFLQTTTNVTIAENVSPLELILCPTVNYF